MPTTPSRAGQALTALAALMLSQLPVPLSTARAAEITVRVAGLDSTAGQLGCALFAPPAGSDFPMDTRRAVQVWLTPDGPDPVCQFHDVVPGSYAVAVSHDLNGNHSVDTNLFGLPTEQWGVSGNARPLLRAPRFSEASFAVQDGEAVVLNIRVAR